jgi:hypothetical protein
MPKASADQKKITGSAMHPKQVEQLAASIRKHRRTSVNKTKAITHIEAAHAKLVQLQTVRQHLKTELTRCIDERDNALLEVERLRNEFRKFKTANTL